MDPEDLREIISAYQKCVAETVLLSGLRRQVSMMFSPGFYMRRYCSVVVAVRV
jgi:hypothetical protein